MLIAKVTTFPKQLVVTVSLAFLVTVNLACPVTVTSPNLCLVTVIATITGLQELQHQEVAISMVVIVAAEMVQMLGLTLVVSGVVIVSLVVTLVEVAFVCVV